MNSFCVLPFVFDIYLFQTHEKEVFERMRALSATALVVTMLAMVALPAAAACVASTCSTCIDESFCGWCASSQTCNSGSFSGISSSANGTCSSSNWQYTISKSSSAIASACAGTTPTPWSFTPSPGGSSYSRKYYTIRLVSGLSGSTARSSIRTTLYANFGVGSSYIYFSTSTTSSYQTLYFSSTTSGTTGSAILLAKANLDAIVSNTVSSSQKTKAQLGFSSVTSSYSGGSIDLSGVATGLGILLILFIVLPIIGVICCIACCVYCCCIRKQAETVVVMAGQTAGMVPQMGQPGMVMQQGQVQQGGYAPMPQQQGDGML
jgi:hypothetical protein